MLETVDDFADSNIDFTILVYFIWKTFDWADGN
jgi:hypothetical protein